MNRIYRLLFINVPISHSKVLRETFNENTISHSVDECNSYDPAEEKFKIDYDVIFLDLDSEDNKKSFLSLIRSNYPLSEIIILSETNDFNLALLALRVGVRDILSLPLSKENVNISLRTAYSYRVAHIQSNKFSKLLNILNHFGDVRKFSHQNEVFKTVDHYITSHFKTEKVSAFAYEFKTKKEKWIYGDKFTLKAEFDDLSNVCSGDKRYTFSGNQAYLNFYNETNRGYFIFFESEEEDKELLGLLLQQMAIVIQNAFEYIKNHEEKEIMSSLAHTDDVTGLYNQRKLYKDIDKNILKSKATNEPFSIVFLDLDNFKNVNDGHGHIVGSKLLEQVAQVIRKVIRDTDYIYRYGGDEFVIILPTAKAENARTIGERLLGFIKKHDFIGDEDKVFNLSISIGIAEFPKDATDREEILTLADKMMYQAKQTGRGRVCSIDEIFGRQKESDS